jgi:predicted dehydrogenase
MPTPLRAVLTGCGAMSRGWIEASQLIPDFELVGFVDIQETAAQKRAAEYGGSPVVGTDLAAVLRQTNPDIVFDCTIPEAHFNVTMTALEHGCHVLGEKPLADSMEHARKMVVAAKSADKLYAVMQNRRYDPNIRRLRHLIEGGALGPLTTLNCDFYVGAHFGGFRDHMKHVLLLDMAIHTFDAARFICGGDPVSVYCKEWNPAGSWYDHDASAVAIFEMSNGIVYTYRGSWCAEGLRTTWESDWRVIGQKGSAHWDGAGDIRAQVIAETGGFLSTYTDLEVSPEPHSAKVDGHKGIIRDFVACVRNGGTPDTICTDNIKSLAMVFGAIESAESGKPVAIQS